MSKSTIIGKFVIVRTYSAGVHMGTLEELEGSFVKLTNSRRLWSWKGANTLNEVSQKGVEKGSRISEPVPEMYLTGAIEVIPCAEAAQANLTDSKWS